ncbi:MAG: molecular chaperone, small heat shock protein [uncultured archaeon A07HB70]|nr:MAG: molecular chaperone, small heat shock protein [uncultured archaeon A07HB70]
MTDDTDDEEPDDDRAGGSIPLGSVFGTLSELLGQLEELDLDAGERRSGSARRGDATFDYNVSVGSINPAGESRRSRRRPDWDIKGESEDHEYRVQINDAENEVVVVADLPSVSAEDLEVSTTDDALEIRVDGAVVESVPLDWDGATVTGVTFENQVLKVRVEPSADAEGADEGGPEP